MDKAARAALLTAKGMDSKFSSMDDLLTASRENIARKNKMTADLAAHGKPVMFTMADGRKAMAGPDMSKPEGFRLTYLDQKGTPTGHFEFPALHMAIRQALDERFEPVGKSGGGAIDNASENIADYVADLLRQGRAKEITDDLMAQADPQRLHHHYTTGNTGMDLPMDYASRMARAAQMGYTNKEYRGVTGGGDRTAPRKRYDGQGDNQIGFWTSNNPYVASTYAHTRIGSVYPFLTKEPQGGFPEVNVMGGSWLGIPKELTVEKGGKSIPLQEYVSKGKDFTSTHGEDYSSNEIATGAAQQGDTGVKFKNMIDPGGQDHYDEGPYDPKYIEAGKPSDITARIDTSGIRSQFARFDPRLDHLAHLSASTGGAMDFARHVEAVHRAGGQIAPSKYLPNVPRQVHAGGGKVAYHATHEPFEDYDWSRLGQSTKENTSGTSVDDWASSLASLGPWSHEKPLSKRLGMKTDLPVTLTGKEKKFKSLDHLAQEISQHGGPAALREKLVSQGYGHASVDDEEFGGKSYVGLSPDHFKITKAGGGNVEGDNGHIYVVHGGSDFDQIDPSYSGRGEPGNIRPLGNGLYGDVIDHTDPELAARSIEGAKHYARKYGRGEKTLHVFKVPKSSSTVFNGYREVNVENYPKPIEGLGLEPTEELNAYRAHENTPQPPYDPENSADYWAHSRKSTALWNAVKNAADLRMQHLPIGVTEVAIQNPKVATRIGKFSLDTPTSDILDAVKSDVQSRAAGGRVGKLYGGAMGYIPTNWVQAQELAVAKAPRQPQQQQSSTLDTIFQLNELSKMGGTKPTAIAPSPSAASEGHPPTAGVSDAARAAFDALNKGWTGAPISVESAYRDPALNEAVGGAKGSQHLHGNAYDIDTSGWTPEAKLALATQAYNSGFRGFGFYDNNLHFDVGGQRAWGPSYHQDSIPDWAQDWTQQYVYANGGRVHANGGGKMELRSRAAEAIRNQPQLKGNVNQLLAVAAKGKGVKQAELANAGQPTGNIISKEKLAQHFEDAMPDVQVHEMVHPQYEDFTLPSGNNGGNYREHLLHLPARKSIKQIRREALTEKLRVAQETGDEKAANEASVRLNWMGKPSGDNDVNENYYSTHWGKGVPNVLAHVRMNDLYDDNGKALHVQEVQSDWGQDGREKGFYDPQKPIEVFNSKTGETVHATDNANEAGKIADKLGGEYDYGHAGEEKPPTGPYVGNTQHWTDLALKHALTEAAKGGHDRVVFSPGEANADIYKQRTPISSASLHVPLGMTDALGRLYTQDRASGASFDPIHIKDEKELVSQLGRKHAKSLLSQEPTTFGGTSSRTIAEPDMNLGGHGMVDYYNNIVHPSALKLLQQHDPSIKPESYDLPNGYKGFALPMTDTARQSILKNGFGAFKRGGRVGKEEGGEVEQMEQPANGMHMLRMRRAGINTKEDFWNRWRDRMKATAPPNSSLSAIGSEDSHFQQIDNLLNFHRQSADANGIRGVLQRYGQNGQNKDGSMAASMPKAILQGAGIEPTIDNASQIYHSLPDNESGRVGKAGGGEMDGVESNNQNGVSNVGTQNETGTAPVNLAPRAQAGELRDAGGVRGGLGVLQAPNEASLEGLPTKVSIPLTGGSVSAGHDPRIRQIARDYMASTGLPYNPPTKYAKADPTRALRISDAYEAMEDNSSDPLTKASYAAMIKETMAQYHAAKAAGFKAEFWDPQTQEDPYHASPRLATEDIKNNNHMFVFPTDSGYGSDGPITAEQIKTNPLLQPSGETWNGIPVTVNDIFRAVHDYFGHAKEGVGFRADGEENAWRSHAAMYSPLARMAMTSETRGQNSWLNFNPVSGERNRKARTENSTFADQKVGILPHWVHHEGAEDFMGPEEVNAMAAIRKVHGRASGGAVDAAIALTRRFTKDGTGATLALKTKGK